jgi:hypothetical protein
MKDVNENYIIDDFHFDLNIIIEEIEEQDGHRNNS